MRTISVVEKGAGEFISETAMSLYDAYDLFFDPIAPESTESGGLWEKCVSRMLDTVSESSRHTLYHDIVLSGIEFGRDLRTRVPCLHLVSLRIAGTLAARGLQLVRRVQALCQFRAVDILRRDVVFKVRDVRAADAETAPLVAELVSLSLPFQRRARARALSTAG